MALEIAADEAVVGDLELERCRTGGVDGRRPVLLAETEDPEDAAHADLAIAPVDRGAERADVRAGPGGLGQQRDCGGRGPRRPIVGMDPGDRALLGAGAAG